MIDWARNERRMSRGNARQEPALPPGGGLPPQPVAQKLVPGPAVPLLPTDGPRSDAVQPAPQFHKAAKTKSAYENVLDLDEEQLRGISLTALLAGGAKLFARHGAAAREDPRGTYALSRPVVSLNYFCSHSWATSRWHKYAALLVHFNLGRALIASLLMCYFCLFLQLWFPEWTPSWWWSRYPLNPDMATGRAPYSAEMFVAPTFFIVLCTAHRFTRHRSLFLDIACIRQDSDAAKADGIAALGAVLDRSERMLVLCDANYFSRLWCTFELAAYTKRAGVARIDLMPLHEALVLLTMVGELAAFFMVGAGVGQFVTYVFPEVMENPDVFSSFVLLFLIAIDGPAQFFIVKAQVAAHEGQEALAQLKSFKLADAQCHSDSDRDELQALIARWFTEQSSGDGDAEDARRVGFHRFEQFVRHTVSPSLQSGRSHYLKLVLAMVVVECAPTFDMLCHEGFTTQHAVTFIAMTIMSPIIVPFKLFVYWRSARVVIALRKRCGCPAVVAYGVGVLLNLFGTLGMVLMFILTGPTVVFDPAYKYPDDGLTPSGHKMLATQIAGIYTAGFTIAIAMVFEL